MVSNNDVIKETKTVYLVEFEGSGYYAKKQPTYEWCFTKNVDEAYQYSTRKGANSRGMDSISKHFRIVELKVEIISEVIIASDWASPAEIRAGKIVDGGPNEKITLSSLILRK